MTKICIVTACGNKKHEIAKPAWKIYKSPRIKAVYNAGTITTCTF